MPASGNQTHLPNVSKLIRLPSISNPNCLLFAGQRFPKAISVLLGDEAMDESIDPYWELADDLAD